MVSVPDYKADVGGGSNPNRNKTFVRRSEVFVLYLDIKYPYNYSLKTHKLFGYNITLPSLGSDGYVIFIYLNTDSYRQAENTVH